MKKAEVIEFAKENGLDVEKVLEKVREEVQGTAWSCLRVETGDETSVSFHRHGYFKNSTGQRVPNAYRSNFGWKNTHYEPSRLIVTFGHEYKVPL